MSSSKTTPDTEATPRVHHETTPGQTTPGLGADDGQAINPLDYNNPLINDYLAGHLPAGIVMNNGMPEAAPAPAPKVPPDPVLTPEQAARQAVEACYTGLTGKPETFWPSVATLIRLGFLQDGINLREVRVKKPFNSGQVLDGGMAVVQTIQNDPKAKCMEVDVNALATDMAQSLRIQRALETLKPAYLVADANDTVVLDRIATRVDKGLAVAASVIEADGNLARLLEDALAIKGGPAAAAVQSRAENARTAEKAVAKATPTTPVVPAGGPPGASTPAVPPAPAPVSVTPESHKKK
jgi:hypothetical protein